MKRPVGFLVFLVMSVSCDDDERTSSAVVRDGPPLNEPVILPDGPAPGPDGGGLPEPANPDAKPTLSAVESPDSQPPEPRDGPAASPDAPTDALDGPVLAADAPPVALDGPVAPPDVPVPPPAPPPGCDRGDGLAPHDSPCKCDRDCGQAALCLKEEEVGIPGGSCFRTCKAASDCGEGYHCEIDPDPTRDLSFCVRKCRQNSDCAVGRICETDSGRCTPLCTSHQDCRSGHCDAYSGFCTAGPTAGLGLMRPCNSDSECRSAYCHPLGRRCTSLCSVSRPFCPEGAVCGTVVSNNELGSCYPPCEAGNCQDRTLQCVPLAGGRSGCVPQDVTGCSRPLVKEHDGNCGCQDDCPTGSRCLTENTTGDPRGACLKNCLPGSSECGTGFFCSRDGLCLKNCDSDAQCPQGSVCGGGACMAFCRSDADCARGPCNPYTGRCPAEVSPGSPNGARNGDRCTQPRDCRSGLCSSSGAASAICLSFCHLPERVCPDGGICIDDGNGGSVGLCFKGCASDADCAQPGVSCQLLAPGNVSVCRPSQ